MLASNVLVVQKDEHLACKKPLQLFTHKIILLNTWDSWEKSLAEQKPRIVLVVQ